jgi:hypothetical protein
MGNWTKQNFFNEEVQMTKKSLDIKEMHIKTTLWFYLTPVRIATTNTNTNKCWQGFREKGTVIHFWCECKLVQPLLKTIYRLLKKLKIDLPYDPAIPLLVIYSKECDSGYCKGTYTPMSIAALFSRSQAMKISKIPCYQWID